MRFIETPLSGLYIIETEPFKDERGEFYRYYCKERFKEIGHKKDFVQMNHSSNKYKGTFRGFHYQIPPKSEIKLVRCTQGSLIDIVVDVRKNSRTFLQSFSVELSAQNGKSFYVPEGFAHGFFTLEDNSTLNYAVSANYEPLFERSLNVNDPMLNIELPAEIKILSDKDNSTPHLRNNFIGI